MRVKSRYRKFQTGGAVTPVAPVPGAISQGKSELAEVPSFDSLADTAPANTDDASLALEHQINALHKSEETQRQRQPLPPPQSATPTTREEKLRLWESQGLDKTQREFLLQNPKMIDNDRITSAAATMAHQQGHQPDSEDFYQAMKGNFNDISEQIEHELHSPAAPRSQRTPEFFQHAAPPSRLSAAHYSAPVSRDVPSSDREPREINSGRVTLTVAELEIARSAGLTPVEYARGKRELEQKKRDGYYSA